MSKNTVIDSNKVSEVLESTVTGYYYHFDIGKCAGILLWINFLLTNLKSASFLQQQCDI